MARAGPSRSGEPSTAISGTCPAHAALSAWSSVPSVASASGVVTTATSGLPPRLARPLRWARGLRHMEARAAQRALHPVRARRSVPEEKDPGALAGGLGHEVAHTSQESEMRRSATPELLGAHVSIQGGVDTAPERGVAIGATAIQVFTKTPNQWREPTLAREVRAAFRRAVAKSGLRGVISHDSYLINLASPDPALSARSVAAFTAELERCRALGIRQVVSHPGNYIDDRNLGLRRNAAATPSACGRFPARSGCSRNHRGHRHGPRQHLRGVGRAPRPHSC